MADIQSVKAWITQATKKKNLNNPKFLQDTRSFLMSCEAKEKIAPIFSQWEKTPITNKTIDAIYKVLIDLHCSAELDKAERTSVNSNVTVCIYGSLVLDGPIQLLDGKKFARFQDAETWADNHLVNQPSNAYAVIDSHTEKTKLTIYRQDALARSYEKRVIKAACTDQVKVSKDRLSWGVGGQYNKRFYFSRG